MKHPQPTDGREFGPVTSFLIRLAGADADVLKHCPIRDIHNVTTIAWLLLMVWVWQCVLFTMVGHMMLARGGEWRLEVIAGAVLIATVILLVDSYVIVRSSWHLQGVSELKRGGLEIPGTTGARIKNGAFILVRLMLSTVLAMLTALFLSILLFEKDINANLDQQFQKVNAGLIARITSQVDEAIAKVRTEHQEIRARLSTLADEEKMLRAAVIDPTGDNAEFKAALNRVAAFVEARAEAQRELMAAERLAADELGGARSLGTSGIPGYGPLRRAADEKIASARRKLLAATNDVEVAEKQIEALRESLKEVSGTKRSSAEAKLAEIAVQRKEKEERLALVEADLRKREENRDRTLRTAFENDPTYQRREDGFIARLEGLERISGQFHVKFVVVIFHIALFGIELAAVLAKIATFIPASYTTILAHEDFVRVARTAVETRQTIDLLHRGPEVGVADVVVPVPIPEPPPPQTEEARPPKGAEDLGDALRQMFPQAETANEDAKPPHNDTAFRKRRGRPMDWKPLLKEANSAEKTQPVDGEISPA